MDLMPPAEPNIQRILNQHDSEGGNSTNASLRKLFVNLNNEENIHEVTIKVAALNQIYSTSIQYITPVAFKIFENIKNTHKYNNINEYVSLVDTISTVTWISQNTSKKHTRCNMSFSSKYIHFLNGYLTPIYDSYIWILLIGYLNQNNTKKSSFKSPTNYNEFYAVFTKFRNEFSLESYSTYEIDKFLWQYGKNLINEIINVDGVTLDKAKSILRRRITTESNDPIRHSTKPNAR